MSPSPEACPHILPNSSTLLCLHGPPRPYIIPSFVTPSLGGLSTPPTAAGRAGMFYSLTQPQCQARGDARFVFANFIIHPLNGKLFPRAPARHPPPKFQPGLRGSSPRFLRFSSRPSLWALASGFQNPPLSRLQDPRSSDPGSGIQDPGSRFGPGASGSRCAEILKNVAPNSGARSRGGGGCGAGWGRGGGEGWGQGSRPARPPPATPTHKADSGWPLTF